jgi:hypothetical protein
VARRAPSSLQEMLEVAGVRRWQVEAFGADLLAALKNP